MQNMFPAVFVGWLLACGGSNRPAPTTASKKPQASCKLDGAWAVPGDARLSNVQIRSATDHVEIQYTSADWNYVSASGVWENGTLVVTDPQAMPSGNQTGTPLPVMGKPSTEKPTPAGPAPENCSSVRPMSDPKWAPMACAPAGDCKQLECRLRDDLSTVMVTLARK